MMIPANINHKPRNELLLKSAQKLALFALALPLAAGKWGSYIGFYNQGIFISDLCLLVACIVAFIIKPRILFDNLILFTTIWIFIISQFIRNPELENSDKIRDLIPYIYLGFYQPIAFLCESIGFRTILTIVRIATLFHLLWSSAISLDILKPFSLPFFFGMPIFTTRWDQTGFVIAIGLVAWSGQPKYQFKGNNFVRFGFLLLAFSQGSRAGLLAFVAALLWVIFHNLVWDRELSAGQRDNFVKFLFALGMIAILLLPSLIRFLPENSALGRIGILEISESARASANGTANGRNLAQRKLLNWVELRNQNFLGVGPGVEMVYESGAFLNLSGSKDVRSPHSWPVGALARFGIFGFCLWISIIHLISRFRFSDFKHPASSWVLSIIIASLVGVIIESPFGSLPLLFFLSLLRTNNEKLYDHIQ